MLRKGRATSPTAEAPLAKPARLGRPAPLSDRQLSSPSVPIHSGVPV
jgi:hypothetical protein